MPARPLLVLTMWCAGLGALHTAARACPADIPTREPGTQLSVQTRPDSRLALDAAALRQLPQLTLTQTQSVSAPGGGTTRSVAWSGVLLRELLLQAGFGGPDDRGARTGLVEAVATDGYRAVFSWGEVFNSALGDQLIVIHSVDGRALDTAAGPLTLRSLADVRPGPRHVRNLCALVVRRL